VYDPYCYFWINPSSYLSFLTLAVHGGRGSTTMKNIETNPDALYYIHTVSSRYFFVSELCFHTTPHSAHPSSVPCKWDCLQTTVWKSPCVYLTLYFINISFITGDTSVFVLLEVILCCICLLLRVVFFVQFKECLQIY